MRGDKPSTVLRGSEQGTERLCRRCNRWLLWTHEHFYRNVRNPSGLTASCQACIKTANALHKKLHRPLSLNPGRAHADDTRYWLRYRSKNARRAAGYSVRPSLGSWRDIAAPVIAGVIARVGRADARALRKALHDAYPFGQRAYWPYKVWCDEVRRQRGVRSPGLTPRERMAQAELFSGA